MRCVKGRGEAEATCARLNAKGVCIQLMNLRIELVKISSNEKIANVLLHHKEVSCFKIHVHMYVCFFDPP